MKPRILPVEQGTPEWDDARRGILTASTIGQLITAKTVKPANNPESRALTAALVSERITGLTDDRYVSYDMQRGHDIEPIVRDIYSEHYAPVTQVGFILREEDAYTIGYSPDGLVGDDGLIETKSRRPKEHLATILADAVPSENVAQCQAALFVSGRDWLDYLSFCGGMPLWKKRVLPDPRWQEAIARTAQAFEETAAIMRAHYDEAVAGLPQTERTLDLYTEMTLDGHH